MHFFVTGKEFEQPVSATTYSRGDFDQLFTFGDRANPGESLNINPEITYPIENWSVINHSANGFRLAQNNPGQRIRHGQLMLVCPHDGKSFLLTQATWLMQEESGGIVLGVATLPGLPLGIGVRFASNNGGKSEVIIRAFLLPPVPVFKEEGSIVLPSGMYNTTRTLEVFSADMKWQLRMSHIIQRGTDFDRIAYQAL
ncbi:MAG TPA: hypothetical protein VLA64_14865 [Azonexus sp.]|nr:hypothetical protein [Azonexus sp.]